MKLEVHTLRFGSPEWMAAMSPTLDRWCERHGHKLVVWDDPAAWKRYPTPKLVEIDALKRFLKGDATHFAWVDADVFVHPEAPAMPAFEGIAVATDCYHAEHQNHWESWCEENFLEKPEGFQYSNAGIYFIDRKAAEILVKEMKPPFVVELQEQHLFNWWVYRAAAAGMDVTRLPSEFNRAGMDFEPAWMRHFWGLHKLRDFEEIRESGMLDKAPDGLRYSFHPGHTPYQDRIFYLQFVKDSGLGNRLFELAAGLAISKRLGIPMRLNWKPTSKRDFGLEYFGIGKLPFREVPVVSSKLGQGNRKIVEKSLHAITDSWTRVCAVAHPFQAEECFAGVEDEIRRLYKLEPLKLEVPEGRVPVAIQVRRGDYVNHPRLDVVTEGYFLNAMDWMRQKLGNPHFFVVSDDPAWCRKMFGGRQDATVMPPQEAIDGLRTMAACEAHIISNSTYGWWGAWLAEEGPVVVPEIWHHRPGSYGDWKPAPERWVRVSIKRGDVKRIEPEVLKQTVVSVEAEHRRVIVYPYHLANDRWHSLRYSLRSVGKHFTDKNCPIIVLGTARPHWLTYKKRVRFVECWGYEAALLQLPRLASKTLWMNDDICLLRDTGWEDFEKPLHFGPVTPELRMDLTSRRNGWRDGYLKILDLLEAEGIQDPVHYSTHTPYLYDREQVAEVFRKFGVWAKMPLEMAVFNLFPREGDLCNGHRTQQAPFGDARFLNHTDRLLDDKLKGAIAARFPEFAPWEIPVPFL